MINTKGYLGEFHVVFQRIVIQSTTSRIFYAVIFYDGWNKNQSTLRWDSPNSKKNLVIDTKTDEELYKIF
jgi:hypothetical protein